MGEAVGTADFVAPPKMLSSETTEYEMNWSRRVYARARISGQRFSFPGCSARPWRLLQSACARALSNPAVPGSCPSCSLALLMGNDVLFSVRALEETVLDETYTFQPAATGREIVRHQELSTPRAKRQRRVEVSADLENNWAYFDMALINDDTGQAYDFGREVSYYHGVDRRRIWRKDRQDRLDDSAGDPGGRYYLRIEPEIGRRGGCAKPAGH